ncbi:DUF420 domain-containing protein [Alienimonas chondri]|uniref:DUF420 domain-containing protein n=1 Tax=Alienimonas chondri TaxID=2681879 RepID=A0ABX1VFZ6_9PLAN|nr:DUF420 domain-containing protein [Alienimonas chondri]NNJ26183.1 hypothetical protein [Alienimonas chondri]
MTPEIAEKLALLPAWAAWLPSVNASLNALAGVLLAFGLYYQRTGRIRLHKRAMLAALGVSGVFLACYLVYHAALTGATGLRGRPFEGAGAWRWVYYAILGTHVPLAAVVPVAAFIAIWHAMKGRIEKHTAITRWLWPVWMYVSITGVVIYGMLYHWPVG